MEMHVRITDQCLLASIIRYGRKAESKLIHSGRFANKRWVLCAGGQNVYARFINGILKRQPRANSCYVRDTAKRSSENGKPGLQNNGCMTCVGIKIIGVLQQIAMEG